MTQLGARERYSSIYSPKKGSVLCVESVRSRLASETLVFFWRALSSLGTETAKRVVHLQSRLRAASLICSTSPLAYESFNARLQLRT